VLEHFRWSGGHADIWRVFADGASLRAVVEGLVAPWQGAGVTHVVGVESRGFLLGAPCAVALNVGLVAIRKDQGGLLPGEKVSEQTAPDYRGNRHVLRMQRVLGPQDRVLLVDDWAERGSQALSAKALVELCGAQYLGATIVVDQLSDSTRSSLGRVTALVHADELGEPTEK